MVDKDKDKDEAVFGNEVIIKGEADEENVLTKHRTRLLSTGITTTLSPVIPVLNNAFTTEFWGKVEKFSTVLGTTFEQRKASNLFNKYSENLKQYVIRELQNPEEIIVLVCYTKDPMARLKTS